MDDVTTSAMPQVTVYPVCGECSMPYVLRKNIVFAINLTAFTPGWLWQRDCKHKNNTPIVKYAEVPRGKAKKKAHKK